MIEYANLYLASISALSSLIHIASAFKESKHRLSIGSKIAKIVARATIPYKVGGKKLAVVIDDDLLNALTVDIQNKLNQLALILTMNNATWTEKESLLVVTEEAVCTSLNKIRDLNLGELPTTRLNNLWVSHNCESK